MAIYSWMKESGGCQDWISCLQQGDEKALEHFYGEHNKSVYNFVHGIVQQAEDAKDIVQESFMKLWNSRTTLKSELHLLNFLYLVAGQEAIQCLRRRGKDNLLQKALFYLNSESARDMGTAELNGMEVEIMKNMGLETLSHYVGELPPGCREVFKLWYYHKKNTKEIADQLDIATQTVLNQKGRAIKLLKQLFFKQEISLFLFFLLSLLGS